MQPQLELTPATPATPPAPDNQRRADLRESLPVIGAVAFGLAMIAGGLWWSNREVETEAAGPTVELAADGVTRLGETEGEPVDDDGSGDANEDRDEDRNEDASEIGIAQADGGGDSAIGIRTPSGNSAWTFSDWDSDISLDLGGLDIGKIETTQLPATTTTVAEKPTTTTTPPSTASTASTSKPASNDTTTTSVSEGVTDVWGQVVDTSTGQGLADVPVELHTDRNNDGAVEDLVERVKTDGNGWFHLTPPADGCYAVVYNDVGNFGVEGDQNRWVCTRLGDSVHVADGTFVRR